MVELNYWWRCSSWFIYILSDNRIPHDNEIKKIESILVDPPQRQPSSLADDPLSIITFMLQRGYSLLAPSLLQSTPVDLANRIAHNLL